MKYDVCVFGGCSLDQTFFQKMDGTYSDVPDSRSPGGKGSNQAVAAAKAGAKTTIITRLGKDEIGYRILENLKSYQVDTSNVELVDNVKNDYSNIYINITDKDNEIKRFSGAIDSFTPQMIDQYQEVLLKSKIIVCQLKVPKEVTEKLIEFCYDHNKTLILTPCRPEKLSIRDSKNLELIDKISIITCNKKECETIFATDDIESCVLKYPNKLIVTLGSEGLMYHNGHRIVKMPAIETNVIDTTGSGDTLNGNLSAFLSHGMSLQHALRKAMYASAMKLTQRTAQAGMPYLEDLENFIQTKRNKDFTYSDELNYAIKIVKEAYELVKYNRNFMIHSKEDATLVTDVDIAIDKFLIDKIKEKYKDDHFVTEEHFPGGKILNRTWVIDPVDGTIHFIKKDGFWGIQLAFYDCDTTKFSIIYLPEQQQLYYAAENMGAYMNNERILPQDPVPLAQTIVEFGGSLHKALETKKVCFYNLIENSHHRVGNILHINTCCISFTNLVSNKTDALIISSKKPWDVLPGELLCKECNIPITYLDADQEVRLFTKNEEIKKIILKKTSSANKN